MVLRRLILLVCLMALAGGPAAAEDPPAEAGPHRKEDRGPKTDLGRRLQGHVKQLAAEALGGRATWDERQRAAALIESAFKRAGLAPAPGRASMILDQGGTTKLPEARHVVGWLPGGTKEYVLVVAHYTGYGKTAATVSPSANDGASAVATLIEVAQTLAAEARAGEHPKRRALCFVALDKKKWVADGADLFASAPPVPLAQCAGVISLEMLGRAFLNVLPGVLFAMGTEYSAGMDQAVRQGGDPDGGALAVVRSDLHFEKTTFRVFRDLSVPFAYVSGGMSLDRSKKTDTESRLDYVHFEARTRWVEALVRRTADLTDRPVWREPPAPDVTELRTILGMIPPIRARLVQLKVDEMMLMRVDKIEKALGAVIERGTITPQERQMMILRIAIMMRETVGTAK